jgi:hypothetical protein
MGPGGSSSVYLCFSGISRPSVVAQTRAPGTLTSHGGVVNERVKAEMLAAPDPRPADLSAARDAIMKELSDGTRCSFDTLLMVACQDADAPLHDTTEIDVYAAQRDESIHIDADQPILRRRRVIRALHEVLADLHSDGVLVPVKGPDGGGADDVIPINDRAPGGGACKAANRSPSQCPLSPATIGSRGVSLTTRSGGSCMRASQPLISRLYSAAAACAASRRRWTPSVMVST